MPASEPSVHAGPGEWCRCSALAQSTLTWLCVPFGPQYSEGYGQPVTVDIGPNHATDFKINPITDLVVVQGELTSRPHIAINVKSETVTAAGEYVVSGLVDLVSTQDRVQRLLCLAYAEAPSNAVVRTLEVTGYTPDILGLAENPDSITITDLANKIHMYEAGNGRKESRGDGSTIGGVATAVVIDAAGNATPPKPITF
ncbi:hypothetical protein GS925_03930 [Rhodococcus hoagii]|nr:hypothetical protein [Prescottella equi]NKU37699.1 hypothetical protein [Prescottella equi]NKU57460.1 hypothetical protein [Prescottella equi]NKV56674.1 hypothetical protein [Prescottella equi]NKV72720.1 hypothetical protein [Prescottella equi]